ncbi:DUF5808 domain-containing protein [Flavobacterium sp. LC2016-12]|uniref:DUF5808 domain-containing protein n=1 Tax=Flavobacterium sp. LC2016-12 TaxID=2783794 RepID=UPI00188BDACB|nr:DUF5808 domain-containing protein [Flavobacterium sp. LC2016-12]MBF4465628.1 hypothetical protein [Flavobacterium sp. LC2016-12]
MNSEKPTQEDYNNWHKDPNNWYLGFLYYNPKDKRLFTPKRIWQLGLTINLANPYSTLIVLALFSIIILALLSR